MDHDSNSSGHTDVQLRRFRVASCLSSRSPCSRFGNLRSHSPNSASLFPGIRPSCSSQAMWEVSQGLRRFLIGSCGTGMVLFSVIERLEQVELLEHLEPVSPLDVLNGVQRLNDLNNLNGIRFGERSGGTTGTVFSKSGWNGLSVCLRASVSTQQGGSSP
jgi:hypothetical protein